MKCQLSFDSNDKICTQPSNRMRRYTRRDGKNELTKWKSNGSKLVCAITDLEEITETMKRTHQIKTYGGLAMSKKDTDTVTQHVRTQCTRNFVEWFHPSSAEQPLLLVFLFRPTHKTKPTILISFMNTKPKNMSHYFTGASLVYKIKPSAMMAFGVQFVIGNIYELAWKISRNNIIIKNS